MLDDSEDPSSELGRPRGQCKLDLIFRALRDVVKRDVEEINKLPVGHRHSCAFESQEALRQMKKPDWSM